MASVTILPEDNATALLVRDSADAADRLNYNETGALILSGDTGTTLLRVGGAGSIGLTGIVELRGDHDQNRSALAAVTNRTGTGDYRPISMFARYQGNEADPFTVGYQGISSILNYGEFASGTVKGTAAASEFFIDIYDNDNPSSAYGAIRAGIDFDPSGATFPTTTPGRGWVVDATLVGPRTNQADLLTGITMLMQQRVATQPSGGPSLAFAAIARAAALDNTQATNPVDYGYLVAGTSGTPGSETGSGYKVGYKLGGFGSGWMSTGRSIIDEAAVFEDWRSGLKIWKRQTGGTQGPAISVGWDGSGAASSSSLHGIDFGGDGKLYRSGTNTLRADTNLSVNSNVLLQGFGSTLTAPRTCIFLGPSPDAVGTAVIDSGGGFRGLQVGGTYTISNSPTGTSFIGVNFGPIINLDNQMTTNLQTVSVFRSQAIVNMVSGINYGSIGTNPWANFVSSGVFNPGTSGASAIVTAFTHFLAGAMLVDTGWNFTSYRGMHLHTPTGAGSITNLVGLDVEDFAARGSTINAAIRTLGLNDELHLAGPMKLGNTGAVAGTDHLAPTLELERTRTITGAVADGFVAALALDPAYDAATSQTVTRHNYIDVQDVATTGAGPAAVTDACVLRFDAALGTHKATTNLDKTGNAKTGTVKINVNGTIHHVQLYAT